MPRETPPSSLEAAITRNTRAIEGLTVRIETIDQSFDRRLDRVIEGLEAVSEQIGRLSEATYETHSLLREAADRRDRQIDQLLEQQGSKLDRVFDAIQSQSKIAEAQASNIAALTRLVEMLVSRN